jgi:hypothetical protein
MEVTNDTQKYLLDDFESGTPTIAEIEMDEQSGRS